MHFWIDKRSQCGYSGRRVPPSLSSGVGRTRRERQPKRMVTPVHRFQSVECVAGSARRPPGVSHSPRIQQPIPNTSNYNNAVVGNGVLYPTAGNIRGAVEVDSSVYLEMSRQETVRTVEIAPINPSPPQQLMPAHLKCGIWASFTFATLFVAGAKFYFDHQIVYEQGAGMELLVFCALMVVFLLCACTISLCRTGIPPMPLLTPPIPSQQDSNEDLALGTVLSVQVAQPAGPPSPEPPPPPYHIAVLLPQRDNTNSEAPPPTYEKAIS
ncbi:uncharacterized protein LOC143910824 [Arctopsyche grandis]|uniref:uncharacterized protein LOC143910824 n=1 Tax=Arctopsyche grandis TaxID=121162 RepID=UPI00406D8501